MAFPPLLRLLSFLLALTLTLNLGACSAPANPDQLALSILSDPKTFNAVLSQESPNIFGLTYEGLIRENPLTGVKEPALAESWQISEDAKTITFTLRENLRWSDGEPLTIEDVLFSYNELYLNPKIPNNYRDSLRVGKSGAFPQIKGQGERQIVFTINEPFAPFLDGAELPILPAHILRPTAEKLDPQGNPQFLTVWGTDTPPEEIVVNGAYRLVSYLPSQRLIFEKNPRYWRQDAQGQALPHIPRVIWAIVESTDTALLQFRSGGLDSLAVSPESFSLLKQEEKRGNFTIYNGGPAYGSNFLTFNLNQGRRDGKPLVDPVKAKWFNDLNFRQAIAYGVDRERMVNNIFRGLGEPQNSPVSVQSPFYDRSLRGYPYDPQKARALLAQSGFYLNPQGELLDKENNPVRFTLHTNAGNKIREAMGAQVQEDLGKLGIRVDFSPLNFGVLVDKLSNSLEWEAVILGLTGGNDPHAPNIWYTDGNLHVFNQQPRAGSPPLPGQKVYPWEEKIAALALAGSQVLDLPRRKEIYNQFQQEVETSLPFIYLVNAYSLGAVRNRFCGIEYSALGGAFWNLEEIQLCP
ncbi:MAG: ABC transporter substrate-binding protein [Cyanobacteria bacterium RI_101]|nr:ABC transporter substrate-binding protein [Cyanobacteria bacterium RI_101]